MIMTSGCGVLGQDLCKMHYCYSADKGEEGQYEAGLVGFEWRETGSGFAPSAAGSNPRIGKK